MNLGSIGVSTMRRIRRIAASAMGGFKINGPPKMGKGPMTNKEDQELSNKASLPQPTQAGRIELCQEAIKEARRCLESNDKDCITRLIKELVRNQCHDGRLIGKEVANEVKEFVHEVWLRDRDNDEYKCELLTILRGLGASKRWVRDALGMSTRKLDKWLTKCGIDWESRTVRNSIVKEIENLLRERFSWDKVRMCEEMWRFIGVDVNEFRRHGIEPCAWLSGLELLSDLRRPYWLGLRASDLVIEIFDDKTRLMLRTTNAVSAIFFPMLLSAIKTPSLKIMRGRGAPGMKYVSRPIELEYYIDLGVDVWPWPIKFSAGELERILDGFSDEELAEFIAGLIDGDGSVQYEETAYVKISACKSCPKKAILDVLKEVIARRFGITGSINSEGTTDVLKFSAERAVKLLRRVAKYMHHPIRRLRAELILAYYDGKISKDEFTKLYEQTEYELGAQDVKRNHALEAATQAAPQTHTHGD
jgi:hypothetical protein